MGIVFEDRDQIEEKDILKMVLKINIKVTNVFKVEVVLMFKVLVLNGKDLH